MTPTRRATILIAIIALSHVGCGNKSDRKSDSASNDSPTTNKTNNAVVGKTNADGWHELTFDNGRFKVRMPQSSVPLKRTANGKHGPIHFLVRKVRSGGVFFNAFFVTYPSASIKEGGGGTTILSQIAAATRKQKRNSQSVHLKTISQNGIPAVEHKYTYPAGTSPSAGTPYAAGYAIHRLYLIDNKVYWVFVDVVDAIEKANREATKASVNQFFDSVVVTR